MLFGLTLLELVDFVAGAGYSVQLALMPEDVRPRPLARSEPGLLHDCAATAAR